MKSVALGGGHGTAVVLESLMTLSADVTGIVSVADDGGSSGKLRQQLNIAAVGDIRRCLSATSDPSNAIAKKFETRIGRDSHPLGNLLLATATLEFDGIENGISYVSHLVGCHVGVLPATDRAVDIVAETPVGAVRGQVAVHACSDIRHVSLQPGSAMAPESARKAILSADLIVAGPGSLYTSVLAALVAPGVRESISRSNGRFVFVANLRPEPAETSALSLEDQISVLASHGVHPDVILCDERVRRAPGSTIDAIFSPLSDPDGIAHNPTKVARALRAVMAN